VSSDDPQIPIVELLPAFEEQTGLSARPRSVSRAALDSQTPLGSELRALAARLRALGRDKRLRRIGVVGAVAGEGSTTVALGLARALAAQPGQRVLLLELDLEHPTLDRELRLDPPDTGVVRFLEGQGEVPLLRHPAPGLWLLSAGAARRPPAGGAATRRLLRLLGAADRVFDYVVGDCPPLSDNRSGLDPQDHMDATVLVVSSRRQPLDTLRRAARQLRPDHVLGMVLNRYEA
jgi:Mrp family chromosome partitioning ATPase